MCTQSLAVSISALFSSKTEALDQHAIKTHKKADCRSFIGVGRVVNSR